MRKEAVANIAAFVATVAACTALALLFSLAVDAAFWVFTHVDHVAILLPAVGFATVLYYDLARVPFGTATGSVIESLRQATAQAREANGKEGAEYEVPPALIPMIFLGTCLTILCGGSVGKEAGALQMSMSAAAAIRRLFHVKTRHLTFLASCGMASALAVLLGMPLASAALAVELMRGFDCRVRDLAGVLLAALAGSACAQALGVQGLVPVSHVVLPAIAQAPQFLLVVVACTAAGALFCFAVVRGKQLIAKFVSPIWVSPVVGGVLAAALLLLVPDAASLSGTGMNYVAAALQGSVASPYFLGKLLFTAFLLVHGFKGGEIMPTMCIGATCGCWVATLVGLDPSFGAVVGIVAGLASAANCPLAAALLGAELLGVAGIPWVVGGALVAFACTMRLSLYGNTYSLAALLPRLRRVR